MGRVLRKVSLEQDQNRREKNEFHPGYRPESSIRLGTGILRALLQSLPTLQKCLQHPRERLQVLHTGGSRHSSWTDRGPSTISGPSPSSPQPTTPSPRSPATPWPVCWR